MPGYFRKWSCLQVAFTFFLILGSKFLKIPRMLFFFPRNKWKMQKQYIFKSNRWYLSLKSCFNSRGPESKLLLDWLLVVFLEFSAVIFPCRNSWKSHKKFRLIGGHLTFQPYFPYVENIKRIFEKINFPFLFFLVIVIKMAKIGKKPFWAL